MADTKISALAAVTAALVADELPVNEAGTSKKMTVQQVLTLFLASSIFDSNHIVLAGTQELTLVGTTKTYLAGVGAADSVVLGTPKSPTTSFTVPNNYFLDQMFRLALAGTVRATVEGTADLILTDDFNTRSRLVLAGRGG